MFYLDEDLPHHPKILRAGRLIGGADGRLVALGLYVEAVTYARHQMTDGILPASTVELFPKRDSGELPPGEALVKVGLFERAADGDFRIHDFHDWNPTAAQLKRSRRLARDRKRRSRARAPEPAVTEPSQRDSSVSDGSASEAAPDVGTDMIPQPRSIEVRTERTAAPPQREPAADPDPDNHCSVVTAVVSKDILPRRLEDHKLMAATLARCKELKIACDETVARKAIDSALFRYYRAMRLEFDLLPDPRGIYHDHVKARS